MKTTKKLFEDEDRAKDLNKQKPTNEHRKRWNRRIRNACRNDYRIWVTSWVQKIARTSRREGQHKRNIQRSESAKLFHNSLKYSANGTL